MEPIAELKVHAFSTEQTFTFIPSMGRWEAQSKTLQRGKKINKQKNNKYASKTFHLMYVFFHV